MAHGDKPCAYNTNKNHSMCWQVECVWAVTRREMLYAIGWTVWGIRDRGWSDGTSWPMNFLRALAMSEDLTGNVSENLMLHGVQDEHRVHSSTSDFVHYMLYVFIIYIVNAWLIFMTGTNTVLLEHTLLVIRRVWELDCQVSCLLIPCYLLDLTYKSLLILAACFIHIFIATKKQISNPLWIPCSISF